MGYKIVKAKQTLDLSNRQVKKGDQIELDEKEAQSLIDRGLAEEGHIEGDAERRRREEDAQQRHTGDPNDPNRYDQARFDPNRYDPNRPTDNARPLSTSNFPTHPDNKMQPDVRSNK